MSKEDEDEFREILNIGEALDEAKSKELLEGKNVFFYPACGLDWQPLLEYFDRCDLFVYCDWNTKQEECSQAINQMSFPDFRAKDSGVSKNYLYNSLIYEFGRMNHLPWFLAQPIQESIEPWGELVELAFRTDEREKKGLLYVAANPMEVYRIMFTSKMIAPMFLYLKRPASVNIKSWRFLSGKDGLLAHVVGSNPVQPSNLIIDNSPANWA